MVRRCITIPKTWLVLWTATSATSIFFGTARLVIRMGAFQSRLITIRPQDTITNGAEVRRQYFFLSCTACFLRAFYAFSRQTDFMFIDEIKIYAQAGHGGKGCVAFHREAYITKGGPSGGNGGRGGSVILQADHDLNNLIGQYYVPRLIAQGGEAGLGKGMDGHAGKDLIIKVPCGTLVWRLPDTTVPADSVVK